MSSSLGPPLHPRTLTLALTAVLGLSAAVYLGYQVKIALEPDDTGRLETTLALIVAGQLERGFGSLYGPFSGANPRVLIHAPLYYRLAALATWPVSAIGVEPLTAALVAGRLLSGLGTLGILLLAYRLARLDGEGPRGGLWAACLIAASPVLGILTVMVRPDTLAVLLQTAGVLLVLRHGICARPAVMSVRDLCPSGQTGMSAPPGDTAPSDWWGGHSCLPTSWWGRHSCLPAPLSIAYALFALAFCAKQHSVFAATASTALLLLAWSRRRLRLAPIARAHAVGLVVTVLYLGLEEVFTGRRMSHSVFLLPGGPFRAINYGSWSHVALIGSITAKKSIGLLALAAACLWGARRARAPRPLDAALLLYLAIELIAFVPLCLFNLGASDNYALQAVVFASVLIGRAAARVVDAVPASAWRLAPLGLAALVVLARDAQSIRVAHQSRSADREAFRALFADPELIGRPSAEFYFVGLPEHNRRFGRAELAHDEWLYAAFEMAQAAEPRDAWLRPALADGPVRQVVLPDDTEAVPGLIESLPDLGYHRLGQFGPYRVWQRDDADRIAARGPAR